jgi:hypothetical protein
MEIAKENSREDYRERVRECQESGLSRKKYCERENLSYWTFREWYRRIENENRGALPFYRLSKILERLDADISRAAISSLAIQFYDTAAFLEIFMNTLKSGEFIRMDETTLQVIHEENREPERKSCMRVAIGYPSRGRPLIYYEYHPTRFGEAMMKFLDGFSGYTRTDGYQAYERAAMFHGIMLAGCFSRAGREFIPSHQKIKLSPS